MPGDDQEHTGTLGGDYGGAFLIFGI